MSARHVAKISSASAFAEDRPAEVVEDDRRVRERRGEIGHVAQIGLVEPRFEGQAIAAEMGESGAERPIEQQVLCARRPTGAGRTGLRPRRSVSNAAETLWARRELRFQDWDHVVAQQQIGGADDPGGHPA